MTHTRFCECCRKRIDLQCERGQVSAKAKELGWVACDYEHDALCDICRETCRIGSYCAGGYNNSFLAHATKDGIEIMDGALTLDWEWVIAMVGKFKDGFTLVPIVPTEKMLDEAWAEAHEEDAAGVWREMIKASKL